MVDGEVSPGGPCGSDPCTGRQMWALPLRQCGHGRLRPPLPPSHQDWSPHRLRGAMSLHSCTLLTTPPVLFAV